MWALPGHRLSDKSDVLRVQNFLAVVPGKPWLRGDHSQAASATISAMNTDEIVQEIDEEISRLEKVRALLTDHAAPLKRGFPPRKRSTMSAEGRARIAAAQRKRWAKTK
jgi:hypothetical protein